MRGLETFVMGAPRLLHPSTDAEVQPSDCALGVQKVTL